MNKPINLLIVDDDPAIVKVFEKLAEREGWSKAIARTGVEALEALNQNVFEAAVVDINLPGYTGLQILEYAKKNQIATEIIIITGLGSTETAVFAIKLGAYDYLTKPFDDITKVSLAIDKAFEHYRLVQKLKKAEKHDSSKSSYEGIIGKSRRMQEIFELVENVAPTNSTALILGESGTGKELIAHALHRRSKRASKPFVVINCAAMPESLLESELFGHRKGSFTGAIQDKKGLFEDADGGTIFLDEIGEVAPSIQVKLLRVLQDGDVRSVGDNASKTVDVRVIAATNKELGKMVAENKFREDLFYRLNVISIVLPPLRERPEDISLLTYHFLKKYSEKIGNNVTKISVEALQALGQYKWVGNVRELENVIERAVVLTAGDIVNVGDLPPRVAGESFYLGNNEIESDLSKFSYQEAKQKAFDAFNKAYVSNLLRAAKGNISFASAKAGMDRSNFKKIVKKCNIDVDELKKNQIK